MVPDRAGAGGRFPTTRWSVVQAAGATDPDQAKAALSHLCASYWYPLYGFVRRSGFPAEDSKDLVQGFFARFLQKDYLSSLTPEAGRFRAYLLAAMRNYLTNQRERDFAQKRGGGVANLSLDFEFNFEDGERRHLNEPANNVTPEDLFHRRWALVMLARVSEVLQLEHARAGRAKVFETLKPFLPGGGDRPTYREAATQLGMSTDAVKVSIHRLRRRYGDLLRAEVAGTVSSPRDVDDEIRFLLDALGD